MKHNLFSVAGFVLVVALASILLACPTPTDPGTGNNPPTATFPPTGYQVSGAGTTAANGNYAESGSFKGFPQYLQSGGSYIMFNYWASDGVRHWQLNTSTPPVPSAPNISTIPYYAPTAATPTESTWTKGSGDNPPPSTLRMPISGSKNPWGGTLTGHFIFQDPDGDSEGATTFQWYRFITQGATTGGLAIPGATSISYTTVLADNLQWLRIEVTPVDEHGTAGTPVLSTSIQVGTS